MTLIVFPRLYTSRLGEGAGVIDSLEDQAIETLFHAHADGTVNTRTWSFQRNVIINAIRLFGDLNEWLEEQYRNPTIQGYNRAFLEDTVRFIETGVRELPVSSWYSLVAQREKVSSSKVLPDQLIETKRILEMSDASLDLLQKWVTQPNGFEDLLMTLHLCFGKVRPS